MPIDFLAVRSRHRLADVARRTGYRVDAAAGDVMVCCPMPDHDDRTPSMILHLDTDRYHCFGCGARGDVIQWVRDIYRVGVADAVRMLEQAGPLPGLPGKEVGTGRGPVLRVGSGADTPDLARTPAERVRAALNTAWRYYSYGALHDAGVAYLTGRGIDLAALEQEIGHAAIGRTPFRSADQLVTHLRDKRGFSDDELVDAGLARRTPSPIPGEPWKVIDFYRRRFVVPVRDEQGRVIGLIGRYDGDARADGVPKYLNPPRTVVYDKAEALYRPSTPRLDDDGQVVVVEGTIDALAVAAAAAKAGFSSNFAPVSESGTALSDTQVDRVLALHDRAPVLACDGDSAGGGANTKWATALACQGRESAIVAWPDGEDPASWLAEHGTAGLAALARKGCLEAPPGQLRPRHSGAAVASALLAGKEGESLEERWRAAFAPAERMAHKAGERYTTAALEALAPVVVSAAAEGSADDLGRVKDVILTVASYGRRLPSAAQVRYAELTALEIERADLGPAGWAQRQVESAMTSAQPARTTGAVVGLQTGLAR
ncbi:toprim domain-containing protein [Acidiferrimicrobium sp. IK]|uniref:CHC2 zinc finger domain-containing protein n=1 Tax=Acidiferrimicrobium sp. IK TaxID=2871700 RepID=UPI0021CB5B1F|nr:CHC2 zinc finger domain-containing protein [Acidiferrimicrobium sp. IK]MCU4183876.1 toprim domain-containing protein [Acidiferrimicrobium sp. IK]